MNALTRSKVQLAKTMTHRLLAQADQVHHHAGVFHVIGRLVIERRDVKIRIEHPIGMHQGIAIERGGDAVTVIVGGIQYREILLQVDSNQ